MNLKEIIKISIAVSIAIGLTLNIHLQIENNHNVYNYIQEDKIRDNQTQNNITKIKNDLGKSLNIQNKIYKEVR